MEDGLTDSEREQLRKMASLQKVALGILLKWKWVLLFAFAIATAAFSVLIVWHSARSGHRFSATTRLLYNPRSIARIETMSDRQLLSVLERRSIKRKVGQMLPLSPKESSSLVSDLSIKQERKPSNLFTLTAYAPTKAGAAKKVNAYAEALTEEYVSYRMHDLESWSESLAERRKGLLAQIAEFDGEESTLKGQTGVIAPVETLTMLNALLSDQRRNLSQLSVQMKNEETKRQKLEAAVGETGPIIAENAAFIRQKGMMIEELDKEIAALRERYTDINPKIVGKLEDRQRLVEEFNAFLKGHGIEAMDVAVIDQMEKTATELAETNLRLEVLRSSVDSLEQEIAANEAKCETLTAIIPKFERLRVRRDDVSRTMRELDEQLEHLSFLSMSVRSDLRQIERATTADGKNPMSKANFLMAAGAAATGVLVLALWILVCEFFAGNVRDGNEMAAYDGLFYLGALPEPGKMTEEEEKDALGGLALKFLGTDIPKAVLLVYKLPGASVHPGFIETLDWSLAMSGSSSLHLSVICDTGFAPPEGAESMLNTICKGSNGWFPIGNRYMLAPTELGMLAADLAELRKKFDYVFVSMPDDVPRGGSCFTQLASACDSILVIAGAGKTPRSWFSHVRRNIKAVDKPAMGMVVGLSAKGVRKEMEDKA